MNVLLCEDEKSIATTLGHDLEDAGHAVTHVPTGVDALEAIEAMRFDCVITDIRMPGADGLEVLRKTKEIASDTEVIVMTGYSTVESAVEAMKLGAFEYVQKPFLNDEIILLLKRIDGVLALRQDNLRLREELGRAYRFDNIVGRSAQMREVFDLVKTVAPSDSSVLLVGESGTGKELIAKAIHHNSPRASQRLVKLSCAAIPETLIESELFGYEPGAFTDAKKRRIGRFEQAHGGTIFLDDIDDMPLATQVKLLRVLQEREIERLGSEETISIDVRVVTATKVDLEDAVGEGEFREDLFYRLNVVPIDLPPLRDREGDIPLLVQHFVERYGHGDEYLLEPATRDAIERYPWPGNVRELENAVERAIALSGGSNVLKLDHLLRKGWEKKVPIEEGPVDLRALKEAVAEFEEGYIARVLKHTAGHKAQAAKILGISRKNLWEKMTLYGMG